MRKGITNSRSPTNIQSQYRTTGDSPLRMAVTASTPPASSELCHNAAHIASAQTPDAPFRTSTSPSMLTVLLVALEIVHDLAQLSYLLVA